MNIRLGLSAALLGASLMVGSAAGAKVVTPTTGVCSLSDVVTSTACIGSLPKPENAGSPSATDIDGLGGFSDWTFIDKVDGDDLTSDYFKITSIGVKSGTWEILNPVFGKTYALALKGSTFFTAYVLSGTSGTWNMNGILNNGGNHPNLSNASLFSRGDDDDDDDNGGGGDIGDVPLPAGLPLMLAGFGAMAFVARRKARKA